MSLSYASDVHPTSPHTTRPHDLSHTHTRSLSSQYPLHSRRSSTLVDGFDSRPTRRLSTRTRDKRASQRALRLWLLVIEVVVVGWSAYCTARYFLALSFGDDTLRRRFCLAFGALSGVCLAVAIGEFLDYFASRTPRTSFLLLQLPLVLASLSLLAPAVANVVIVAISRDTDSDSSSSLPVLPGECHWDIDIFWSKREKGCVPGISSGAWLAGVVIRLVLTTFAMSSLHYLLFLIITRNRNRESSHSTVALVPVTTGSRPNLTANQGLAVTVTNTDPSPISDQSTTPSSEPHQTSNYFPLPPTSPSSNTLTVPPQSPAPALPLAPSLFPLREDAVIDSSYPFPNVDLTHGYQSDSTKTRTASLETTYLSSSSSSEGHQNRAQFRPLTALPHATSSPSPIPQPPLLPPPPPSHSPSNSQPSSPSSTESSTFFHPRRNMDDEARIRDQEELMLLEMAMREQMYEHVYVVGGVVRRMSTIGSSREDAVSSVISGGGRSESGNVPSPSTSTHGHGSGAGSGGSGRGGAASLARSKSTATSSGSSKGSPEKERERPS